MMGTVAMPYVAAGFRGLSSPCLALGGWGDRAARGSQVEQVGGGGADGVVDLRLRHDGHKKGHLGEGFTRPSRD